MVQNIFRQQNRGAGDSGTFSAQQKKRSLPVSRDLIFFVVGVVGLLVLYVVLQGWHNSSDSELQTTSAEYDQGFLEIQDDDFHQATRFVSKVRALLNILDSSPSFIPVIQRFTESVHQDVVLEEISIDIQGNEAQIEVRATTLNVFSLGQQYLVWRDKYPWVISTKLDSISVDDETQEVGFKAMIVADMSRLEGEQQGEQQEN